MTKRAQVGLFTIIGAIAIFAVFYVLEDIGTRSRGYKIGVHFASANGLHQAANVYLSGVPVGAVDQVILQPDYSVDVVMAIKQGYEIPVGSKFLIQAPLTGEPNVIIAPPKGVSADVATLPHKVLPIAEQPRGTNPTTFADLIEEGQGEVRRLDNILAQVQTVTPALLSELQSTLRNANELTSTANTSLTALSARALTLTESLQRTLTVSGNNVADLTETLNKTAKHDSKQIDSLLAQLSKTAVAFNETIDSLRDVATNPALKANLLDTTRSLAVTAKTFAELTNDLRQVTANPQTQAQLRDTVAQLDATSQKIDSLLSQLGGTSSVYGIDRGASPAPGGLTPPPPGYLPTSAPVLPTTPPGPPANGAHTAPPGNSQATPSGKGVADLHKKLGNFLNDLVELQFRLSLVAPERPGSAVKYTTPLLGPDRGIQSDFNAIILPDAHTSLVAGVNDLGFAATGNLLLLDHRGQLRYGGGIEYSRLGIYAGLAPRPVGFDVRFYDPRHPTLDTYLNLSAGRKFQLFGGERDWLYTDRRTVFGLQFEL
ncbi:MAG TPA: MlaD family protein [Candidatus Baltobacteraceae bacterium]|nr:MlaD family protein [Candidatus Baltobacteraceae bacterium]